MLSICNLFKSFGTRSVLQDLTFQVNTGEVYGLLGPNGAGKTTTINILCGLLNADQGTVTLGDKPLTDKSKTLIGVAPQANLVYQHLSCEENLRFFAQLYGYNRTQQRYRIESCLEAVQLRDRAKVTVSTLSGGMQRRLNLAIALVHQPKVLILDEPTTGLDIESRYQLWKLIRHLKQEGITILFTTHSLDEAERLCDRIGILQQGKIIAEGSLNDLRKHINAKEVITIQTPDQEKAILRAKELGWTYRQYGGELALWLSDSLSLKEITTLFEGIDLDSVSRQPVRLEHIYLELVNC